jgi:organic hydroperoxide reductase OsmC/OhrA
MAEEPRFKIFIEHLHDYEFNVKFDWEDVPDLLLDEPQPLGQQTGPNAARVLAAAVGNCLSSSLYFCLQKAKVQPAGIKTSVAGTIERNEHGRLRIARLDVEIHLETGGEEPARLGRCIDLFEDYCLVTASIRQGIPVHVQVLSEADEPIYGKQVS